MALKRRRVRDLNRTLNDFPQYRKQIKDGGWVPHVLCDAQGAYWDGLTARAKDGRLVEGLSDAGQKQMTNMIIDGFFGEELKDAFVDQGRYWKIRDDLITWPNRQVIASEALRVLDVKPRA